MTSEEVAVATPGEKNTLKACKVFLFKVVGPLTFSMEKVIFTDKLFSPEGKLLLFQIFLLHFLSISLMDVGHCPFDNGQHNLYSMVIYAFIYQLLSLSIDKKTI